MIKMLLNPVKHTLAVLKVVAVAKVLVESDGKVAAVLGVVLAELLLQGLGRLLGMVKGQVREDVMADVGRVDKVQLVVEKATHGAIDSAEGAAEPVPFGLVVVRQSAIDMLEERNGDEEAVNDEERGQVQHKDEQVAEDVAGVDERGGGGDEAEAREQHKVLVLGPEHVGRGLEVAVVEVLAFIALVRGRVKHEVHRPANEEHADQARKHDQLFRIAHGRLAGVLGRHVCLVLGDVVGEVVVVGVGALPREVGNKERRVQDEPDRIVDDLVRREAAMATLMRNHPHAHAGGSLKEPVSYPQRRAQKHVVAHKLV